MNKTLGKYGYFIREAVNSFRLYTVRFAEQLNEVMFKIIYWLDHKESVTYWRKKDRGI